MLISLPFYYHQHLHFTSTAVFTQNDGVMLLVQLEPARLGTLSYYLPILLLDEEDLDGEGEGHMGVGIDDAAMEE